MSLYKAELKARKNRELELLMNIASIATDLVNEIEPDVFGNTISPSLGICARLADAVHAHWKFHRGEE